MRQSTTSGCLSRLVAVSGLCVTDKSLAAVALARLVPSVWAATAWLLAAALLVPC